MSRVIAGSRVICGLIAAVLLLACADDAEGPGGDASVDAHQHGDDVSTQADQSAGEGPTGQCATSIPPHTLAAGYCVVATFAAPSSGPFASDSAALFSLEPGTIAKSFVVRRYGLDTSGTGNSLAGVSDVFSFQVDTADDLFAGQYLALSPAARVAVGYTLKSDFAGKVMWGGAGQTPAAVQANGNYDVAFWDEDTLLINGLGAGAAEEGQGLYVYRAGKGRKLVDNLGMASGPVVRAASVLYVGGFFTDANQVFAFTASEVDHAIANDQVLSTDGHGDRVYQGPLTDAAALGGDLLVIDDDWVTFKGIKRVATSSSGDVVSAESTTMIITANSQDEKITGLEGGPGHFALRLSGTGASTIVMLREQ